MSKPIPIGKRSLTGQVLHSLKVIRDPSCTRCCLHESATNICVMGRGNPRAKIFLIGEAPGEAEAKTGKPFMGEAGKLLNGYLNDLNANDKVYITNTVKCRPPSNRKPTTKEADVCAFRYLFKELDLLKPKLLVLMGRTPIDFFFRKNSFVRGKVYVMTNGMLVIPTFHPAYYLHSGSNPEPLGEVIKHAVDLVYNHHTFLGEVMPT